MADHVELETVEPGEELLWVGLPIEDQLLDHLAVPESSFRLWKDRLDPELIEDDGIRDAYTWSMKFMDEHRESPPLELLAEETGYDEWREPVAPIGYVIDWLRARYRRKGLRTVVTKIGRLSTDPEEAVRYGLRELQKISTATQSRERYISSDEIGSFIDRYDESLNDIKHGVSFGYAQIDKALGGLRRNEIVVVLGRPKRYKSWQLLMSFDAAWNDGLTPAMETMELAEDEMFDRWVCMRASLDYSKFKHKMLSADDLRKVKTTAEEVQSFENKGHFFRPKPGDRNVPFITAQAESVEADVLYVDQLSWFDDAKSDDKNWLKIGRIMEQLKDASSMFPIYMAAQFNREAASLGEIGDLSQIGLSDSIGQTADMLLGLYASKEMHENNLLHFGVVESRSFEKIAWELRVMLSEGSTFKVLNRLESNYD